MCTRQNQRAANKTRKERLKSYADMTIYTRYLVHTLCHCKLPTTTLISLTVSNFDISFPLWWPKHMQLLTFAPQCPAFYNFLTYVYWPELYA